jgi:hypothetical protein
MTPRSPMKVVRLKGHFNDDSEFVVESRQESTVGAGWRRDESALVVEDDLDIKEDDSGLVDEEPIDEDDSELGWEDEQEPIEEDGP